MSLVRCEWLFKAGGATLRLSYEQTKAQFLTLRRGDHGQALKTGSEYKVQQRVRLGSTPQVRTDIGISILAPRDNGYAPPC